MTEQIHEVAIVGGGIVGLATARALVARDVRSVVVLEAESGLAEHQTGHNSGVIHSGLYYKPGSLKATNCVQGREAMYRFCAEEGLPHEACGKLVVATDRDEIPRLDELERRGRENGLVGLRRLSPEEIAELEPALVGVDGLLVPETGITDYRQVAERIGQRLVEAGAEVRQDAALLGVVRDGAVQVLETAAGTVRCRQLVNCAGLHSDRVAKLAGVDTDVIIVPFRGEYYELATPIIKGLVYPVPDPRFPFLGVHFTRTVDGRMEAGPNAVLALSRHGYEWSDVSIGDTLGLLAQPRMWKLSLKHWRTGLGETVRSLSKAAFLHGLQRLAPGITADDLVPGGSGVRAQAVGPSGDLLDDFAIVEAPGQVHVLNAPSPAATASLTIGAAIAARVLGGRP